MGNAQLENALKLAWDAYDASNEEEAKSFFNQALTVDPENVEAKVGKGCAILIQFTLAAAVNDAQQAYAYWEQASKNPEFSDNHRSMISKAAIGFTLLWKNAAENHYRQFKEVDSAKNEWKQVQKNIAIYLSNIVELNGMSDYASYLERAIEVTGGLGSMSMEISGLNVELKKKLFFAKHPYKEVIRKAEKILPNRNDYDGKPKFDFPMLSQKKYEFKGKIDVVKDNMKINDIRMNFLADEDAISLGITYDGSIRVEDPQKIESLLKPGCQIWSITSDKKTVLLKVSKEYSANIINDALDTIHKQIDDIISEGGFILQTIADNGGKQSLLGSLFGKK